MFTTLPLDIMTMIFKNIKKDDYTLYSCILVNKQWHNINIQTLWRRPLYLTGSIKILINCLLDEDKNFFSKNNIKLSFQLLDKPTLYNYVKFNKVITLPFHDKDLEELMDKPDFIKINRLKERLIKFVLDHSTTINTLSTHNLESEWLINHPRFNICFENLNKLDCDVFNSDKLFNRLANISRKIQSLEISNCFECDNDNLTQLIEAQNRIKELYIHLGNNYMNFSERLIKAVSKHSNSIIYYKSVGKSNLDPLLVPKFQNLEYLNLKSDINVKPFIYTTFRNQKELGISSSENSFLSDLIKFIKKNGKDLKDLTIKRYAADEIDWPEMIQSIGENCQHLEYLSISYRNGLDQQLACILNNCKRLKHIKLNNNWNYIFNGDKIFQVLYQTLPKNLSCISFQKEPIISNICGLDLLMNSWKGPKPFKLKFTIRNSSELVPFKILKAYEDLGLIDYQIKYKPDKYYRI